MSEKQIIWRNVDDLELWQDNPNQGDIGAIVTSINRFGYNDVVAIWNGRIQGGNHRARAIAQLYQGAWKPGDNDRMARIHDEQLQIGCLDVSHLESEQEANAFGIALNRTTRLGEDDDAKLAALLQDIAAVDDTLLQASGYDGDDLDNLLRDLGELETPDDPGAQVNKADELRQQWQTERGQLWIIPSATGNGEHRILCGDSTDADDVARLMGGGKADAVVTDPPYGIGWDTDYTRFTTEYGAKRINHQPIISDDHPFDPRPYLDYSKVILFGANWYCQYIPIGTWLVWDKRHTSGAAFLSDAELAWMKGGQGVYIYAETVQGAHRSERALHPTQKPVGLIGWCFEKLKLGIGLIIYDPFLGSGTTICACEQTGRVGYGMEIAPKYVAVCLQRLADMGLEPRLNKDET